MNRIDLSNAPLIMGVLNVTPDSFSDGALYTDVPDAITHAINMVEDGADLLDIGAESSRPGADMVSATVEIERLLPVVRDLRKRFPKLTLSIDTYKPEVMHCMLNEGVDLINDICALVFDEQAAFKTIREFNPQVVLMHMHGTPKTMQHGLRTESNIVPRIHHFFMDRIQACIAQDIPLNQLILDPGIGFGKTLTQNCQLIRCCDYFERYSSIGHVFPVMVGLSRKSFIGKVLDLEKPTDRELGTRISEVVALMKGASLLRTHDVKEAVQMRTIWRALMNV